MELLKIESTSQDAALLSRIQRLEGQAEKKLWFKSTAEAMQKVNETLYFLQKEAFKGNHSHSILMQGPKGSAFSSFAWTIHASSRAHSPWIKVQCAGLTQHQAEALFFGVPEKGTPGVCALAQKGTLYLEQVDQLPEAFQKTLAHMLEAKEWKSPDLMHPFEWDVQVIASILEMPSALFHLELKKNFEKVFLKIPSLKERVQDVALFAKTYALKALEEHGQAFEGFSHEAIVFMEAYDWPGNIEEVAAFIDGLVAAHRQGALKIPAYLHDAEKKAFEAMPLHAVQEGMRFSVLKKECINLFEKKFLEGMLTKHAGNVSAAAREACLDRSNFLRLLRRHAIASRFFREEEKQKKVA